MIHCCAVCAVFKKSIDHAVIFTKSETRTSLSCENQNSSLRGKDQTNEIKHTDTETLPMNHPSTVNDFSTIPLDEVGDILISYEIPPHGKGLSSLSISRYCAIVLFARHE
uniref:Uncharacterized protein n=1 Tax=Rhizophagus irregularis (strain DAOM 181602 / DAOM 197198 / MUCL 43194) TaxID=747089 RepID=U9UPQ7_RHIID